MGKFEGGSSARNEIGSPAEKDLGLSLDSMRRLSTREQLTFFKDVEKILFREVFPEQKGLFGLEPDRLQMVGALQPPNDTALLVENPPDDPDAPDHLLVHVAVVMGKVVRRSRAASARVVVLCRTSPLIGT